jgi:AcrR family transcriptional regulator
MITRLTPRERRHYKTKESILRAAREIIAEKGLDGLSLRELARRIDYSPSGLYEYFPSKDDIVTAVRAEGLGLLQDYLSRVPANLPPSERLVEMGLAYLDFAREYPEHFRLIFVNLTSHHTALMQTADSDSPYYLLLQAVEVAIEAGEFKTQEGFAVEEIAFSLWSLVHGMAMLEQTYLRHIQSDFTPLHRQALQVFAAGLKSRKLSAL